MEKFKQHAVLSVPQTGLRVCVHKLALHLSIPAFIVFSMRGLGCWGSCIPSLPLEGAGLYFGNISINHFVIYTCSDILDNTDLE